MPLVKISGLKKSFKGNEVIKGLNFVLKRGKCTALLGPNGAGKTTTLKMLSGLLAPSTGTIEFSDAKKGEDIRRFIGYLPQYPVFYDWMSGGEFLEYAGRLAGLQKKEAKERTEELLALTGIADAKKRAVGKYSGGMKQRLGIAQALIHRPKLIMLDEPVSALDPFGRREVLELLERLKTETTVLFSTHILNDAEEVCDEILFLHDGKIVEAGTMEELRERHQQQKIELQFRGSAENVEELFAASPFVQKTVRSGANLTLLVNDIEGARKIILQTASEKDLPLVKFESSRMSLEDIFMKVVAK
ncbi:ABC transporter ATP-binding protein [Neobacillus notoginsengisoli]|uniref:ABC transporter ATP-binding protein n=1 Tax=Neobacillus notoginsengisoli TaxID=1578198 RepID=A0A417YS06_9BACI|nr:ABC transporter ATP-binding protein [Neobacillus notoginsengisoli]RHW38076.1 ABC transporter ATP-binding protein [Neobacillus notoginsengisoli]